jgi:hypothetical protein
MTCTRSISRPLREERKTSMLAKICAGIETLRAAKVYLYERASLVSLNELLERLQVACKIFLNGLDAFLNKKQDEKGLFTKIDDLQSKYDQLFPLVMQKDDVFSYQGGTLRKRMSELISFVNAKMSTLKNGLTEDYK